MRFYAGSAVRSLRRDALLSAVMIGGLAFGIALWQLADTTGRQQRQGVRRVGDGLYAVALQRPTGGGNHPFGPSDPDLETALASLLPWRDVAALSSAAPAVRALPMATGTLEIQPDGGAGQEQIVRWCTADLFRLFDLGFRAGGPWRSEDAREVVLDAEAGRRWFGAANPVGRELIIGNEPFRVAGVLAPDPAPRTYSMAFGSEKVFLPLRQLFRMRARLDSFGPAVEETSIHADLGRSEASAFQLWVQLRDGGERASFEQVLAAHVESQKAAARSQPMTGQRLVPHAEWRSRFLKPEPLYDIFYLMIALALVGCTLNLVRLWLVLFGARARELGLRRALGASRGAVLREQLAVALIIGILGGCLGVAAGSVGVSLFDLIIPSRTMDFTPDLRGAAIGFLLGCCLALAAAFVPAWRFLRMPPAQLMRRH